MKKQLCKDYHELNGRITVKAIRNSGMTEDELKDYDRALTLLLGSNFVIAIRDDNENKNLVSFSIKDGIASVEIEDSISEEH